jgi:hypothetical protein
MAIGFLHAADFPHSSSQIREKITGRHRIKGTKSIRQPEATLESYTKNFFAICAEVFETALKGMVSSELQPFLQCDEPAPNTQWVMVTGLCKSPKESLDRAEEVPRRVISRDGRVDKGSCLPPAPQIRTCAINASGSSYPR